ncbi:RNA polymerase sigma factor [uncultured Croceitalea sp.]|uniref:RNA polymerase sigma factor n=1 Tax=uncultured Croceitalea sp. TaxID=1798908 RepID=UPI003305F02B
MNPKEKQFKKAYEANFTKVMRLCMGYVEGENAMARDLTQEVFVKVWESMHKFRGESSFDTWIYRIAINTCLLNLRKNKPFVKNYKVEEVTALEIPEPETDKAQMLKQMYACINKLSETNRAIILLELEGMPQKSIAEVMGIRHEAVRTRIHRIKNELTKCIQDG